MVSERAESDNKTKVKDKNEKHERTLGKTEDELADLEGSMLSDLVHTELNRVLTEESINLEEILALDNLAPRNRNTAARMYPKYYAYFDEVPDPHNAFKVPSMSLPQIPRLKKMLLEAIADMEYVEMTPSAGSQTLDQQEAEALVNNIDNECYGGVSSLLGMPCLLSQKMRAAITSAANYMRAQTEKKKNSTAGFTLTPLYGMIEESEVLFDITCRSAVRELECTNAYEMNTLICGRKVWVQYPPTEHNISMMMKYYENKRAGATGLNVEYFQQFQGGTFLIQGPGDTIRIPPFCPTLAFTTRTSVSASYEAYTAPKLPQRLELIGLFHAQSRTAPEARQQAELKYFAAALLLHLQHTLGNKLKDGFDTTPAVLQIAGIWDAKKEEIRNLASATGNDDWGEKMATLWTNWMTARGFKVDQKCVMCAETFQRKSKNMKDRVSKHFVDAHWEPMQTLAKSRKRMVTSGSGTSSRILTPSMTSKKSSAEVVEHLV
jgi:hypothetical protein